MIGSFLASASKKVTDVKGFLRDAAGGNSIKYVPEKGAKHTLYLPYQQVEIQDEHGEKQVVNQLIAISGNVHEWQSPDGKFKATVCIKDVVRTAEDGQTLINDGSCPFCDRVSDAWDIYRYRKELEESKCTLTGEDRKKHLEKVVSTYADERKAKDARSYMYLLVVKYRVENGNFVMNQEGLPEYDLKVMKMSSSRVEKIQQQIQNAGSEMAGSEIMLEYPNTDDRRLLVSQSTTSVIFPNNMLTAKYPALVDKITEDVSKFVWDGIEKSFPEWNGMSSAEAKSTTDTLFEKWDEYKKAVQINPAAQYMEYITSTKVNTPNLGDGAPAIPNAVIDGGIGGEVPPVPDVPDVNKVFEGGAGAPTVPPVQI